MHTERPDFGRQIARLNSLDLQAWVFYPGMLYGSAWTWWDKHKQRTSRHEGIDLCFYRTAEGETRHLKSGTLIPALYNGSVARVINDFLGKTVFIRHDGPGNRNSHQYSIYGHVLPTDYCVPGLRVQAGETIASLADPDRQDSGLLSHLHLSIAWIDDSLKSESLSWEMMKDDSRIRLDDPLHVISWDYVLIADGCR